MHTVIRSRCAAAHHEVEVPLLNGDGSVRRMIKHKRPLTFLPLVALIFYEVSGGPFGTEVRACRAGSGRFAQ